MYQTLTILILIFSSASAYTVSGTNVYDQNGNKIMIRGVDRPSLEWNCDGQYLSLSDYQLMKSWGANMIRLSLSECCLISGLQGYSSTYLSTIDTQVTNIKSLGMGVILDLHWSNQGNAGTTCTQQAMADQYSITFWQTIATHYANDPMVIFELYNEPFTTDWSVWQMGGSTNGFQAVGMQQLYNTVRGTGANNVVIIGGINYAYDLSGVATYAITGTGIIYNTHPYNYGGKQPSNWPASFGYLFGQYPVIATEFGDTSSDSCSTTYYSEFLDYAQQNDMHWTAWGWWVQNCQFPSLIADWTGTPSAAGALVKSFLSNTTALTSGTGVPTSTTSYVNPTSSYINPTSSYVNPTSSNIPTPSTYPSIINGCPTNLFAECKQTCAEILTCTCTNGQPVIECAAHSSASTLRPFWHLY